MMDYKEELKLVLQLSGTGRIFDLRVVKYLDESESLKTPSATSGMQRKEKMTSPKQRSSKRPLYAD